MPMPTKGGLDALSKTAAIEYANDKINTVAPGAVDTPLHDPHARRRREGYWREVWRRIKGNLATWQPGNLATWQPGNLATWQPGNLIDPWSHGDVAAWNDLKSALRANDIESNQMREQMMERGRPLGMTFTPVAAGSRRHVQGH
jgi:NAD(P)-dependent dehydrogenase (short-subunit alcohol dehydrogenase family)